MKTDTTDNFAGTMGINVTYLGLINFTHLKRPLCWERWRAGGEGDGRG